ncbi:MAG: fructosamine kinase family protein [Actinomycetaceae bacterium]|nr:fructosamine kinase family protein [Actinomycetaceae bacterium]
MTSFTKHGSARAIAAEAAGLIDLAQASPVGGAPVVRLLDRGGSWLRTARLSPAAATAAAAEEFGRRLALTHAHCPEGQRVFGQAPSGLTGDGVMGAARLPLVPAGSASRPFGEFYAEDRLLPYLGDAVTNGSIREPGVIERLADRLREGLFDAPQPRLVTTEAALLHGDLWSGNILWANADSAATGAVGATGANDIGAGAAARQPAGGTVAVLIDPACQGGHAESDLAQLTVFGAPHVERIYAAYDEASPLADGWRERVGLHRLHILIVHAALFGGSYGRQTLDEARAYL